MLHDGKNEVVNRYVYDAFGNVVDCEEQIENRFRYCGQQWEPSGNMTKAECRKQQAAKNAQNSDPRYHPDSYYSYKSANEEITKTIIRLLQGTNNAMILDEKEFFFRYKDLCNERRKKYITKLPKKVDITGA